MANASLIDVSRRLIVVRLTGALTTEAVYAQRETLVRDERFDPAFRILVFMDIDDSHISADALGRFAQSSILTKGGTRAIVARSDLAWGFVQMFDAYGYLSGFENWIFRTDDEAAACLELEPELVAALRAQLTA